MRDEGPESRPPVGVADYSDSAFAAQERARKRRRTELIHTLADRRDAFRARNRVYYSEIERLIRFWVAPGQRVLEIGSSTGDLLAALDVERGLGIDIAPNVVDIARAKHPTLEFRVGDAEALGELELGETFDTVIMSDVVGHLDDVWTALRELRPVMREDSRLILTHYNFLWEPILKIGEWFGRKMPVPEQNWLDPQDLENLLELNGFDITASGESTLVPAHIPIASAIANRWLARLPGLRRLSLIQYVVARPTWHRDRAPAERSCTVVVPCRNERGNIANIFARTPELGAGTELIFVDGSSTDGTVAEIERHLPSRPSSHLLHQGDGTGKGDAVRKGFAAATGDVLFILDADLTVPPEDLPKFYAAIAERRGEFINGTRLVYPMENDAMRFLNLLGNKFFSAAFTYILGRPIKDTLCGTKVLPREAYERLAANRAFFGDFDPFGDFDLLFGAAKLGLKFIEVPVRYRARSYGDTKISRFRHGFLLLGMTVRAFRKFKLTV